MKTKLNELMRKCREDDHKLVYADLVDVALAPPMDPLNAKELALCYAVARGAPTTGVTPVNNAAIVAVYEALYTVRRGVLS
jgi:hypothetical protein